MGRIFISAGHYRGAPGTTTVLGTKEVDEMIPIRDLLLRELQARGVEFLSVPDDIDLGPTIQWINQRSRSGDVAIELHGNSDGSSARGAESFYIVGNSQRKADAQLIVNALVQAVPGLGNRGAKPDTQSNPGRLAFCRDVRIPSVLVELCFLTNREDIDLLRDRRDQFARGLADGLVQWSGQVVTPPPPYPTIDIQINDQRYDDKGILVNNNSYIPVDLIEQFGINLAAIPNDCLRRQGNIVYVKAVELQQFNISVGWDSQTRTVILRTTQRNRLSNRIMSQGVASEEQLRKLLEVNNPEALRQFPDLPGIYIQEAEREGVNYDLAFCQMCLETGYLEFGGDVDPGQNNFCGLGAVGGGAAGASFGDARTGVKACIQHLKAYGSNEPVANPPIVDPRFNLVTRGVAPLVTDLSGRWATDSDYGNTILAIRRRLLEIV